MGRFLEWLFDDNGIVVLWAIYCIVGLGFAGAAIWVLFQAGAAFSRM